MPLKGSRRRSSARGPSFAVPARPPPPVSPLVTRLRQDWRWANISQFCTLWLQTLGGPEWDPEVSLSSAFLCAVLCLSSSTLSFPRPSPSSLLLGASVRLLSSNRWLLPGLTDYARYRSSSVWLSSLCLDFFSRASMASMSIAL